MKRRTFTLAVVICLLAIVGFGSLAYFQASKNVTNFFAVAGINSPTDPTETIDPDKLFSIKLDETDVRDANVRTEEGNIYENILPGTRLVKDPTVTNTGKYDAWVRVKVEVSDYTAWATACTKHGINDLSAIFDGHVAADWARGEADEGYDAATDTYTFVYYFNDPVAPNGTATLFEAVVIPAAFDLEDMVSLSTFQIRITGEAIQVANTKDNAKEAFRTFWE